MNQAIDTTPRRATWRDSRGRNWDILVKFKAADGRAIAMSITIDSANGHRLTREVLRELPLKIFTHRSQGPVQARHKLVLAASEYRFRQGEGRRRGALRLEDEEIRLTKEVFMQAYRSGQPTIRAVAHQFGISQAAANKRIMKLRREGLLPPSRLQKDKK